MPRGTRFLLPLSVLALCLHAAPGLAAEVAAAPSPSSSKTTHVYKSAGGCDIKADVYRMPGEDVRPAIVWIHGGALIFGNRGSVRPDQLQRYLQAGYVVVSIDYRLAPETKLPGIVEDLRDAYRWVREKGPALFSIDPDRVAVVGNSAGGYLALTAGYALTPRPAAIVSFYGYGDITGSWTTRPSKLHLSEGRIPEEEARKGIGSLALSESPNMPRVIFYNYCRQNGLWPLEVAGADPGTDMGRLESLSPVRHVAPNYSPTLLLHGDKDTDVPFEESVRMARALKRSGVPHRLVRMRGYDHLFDVFPTGWTPDAEPIGLSDPKVAAAYDEVIAFLAEHVGRRGPATP